jgi:hypothetical protein
MNRSERIQVTTLGTVLLAAVIGVSGCGSGGSALGTTTAAHTASIAGRLISPAGAVPAGTTVVAEELIGGRTATVRAIAATRGADRSAMVARIQAAGQPHLPGVYTTTAMADGAFLFRDLPPGEYCLTARSGDLIGVLSGLRVGAAGGAAAPALHLAAGGTISGKVRYEHPADTTTEDNSGIMAFVQGTSFIGFSQGTSGDYTIPNVPMQGANDAPYTVGTMASGFADDNVRLPGPLVADSITAPLIFLVREAPLIGRVIDPTVGDPDKQGLSGANIVTATGQSGTSNSTGFFEVHGLKAGGNFVTITRTSYKTYRKQIGPLLGGATFYLPVNMSK